MARERRVLSRPEQPTPRLASPWLASICRAHDTAYSAGLSHGVWLALYFVCYNFSDRGGTGPRTPRDTRWIGELIGQFYEALAVYEEDFMIKWRSLLVIALLVVLVSAACRSATFDETVIIAPGASHSWDVREYDSCEYSFFVRQHERQPPVC